MRGKRISFRLTASGKSPRVTTRETRQSQRLKIKQALGETIQPLKGAEPGDIKIGARQFRKHAHRGVSGTPTEELINPATRRALRRMARKKSN